MGEYGHHIFGHCHFIWLYLFFLPDAKVKFRDMLGGAIFTGLLFMLGRYGISIYLNLSSTASFYGAAGSIIVMLLWIYYSAAILYFMAEFTKFYAIKFGAGIVPSTFAVAVEQTEKLKKQEATPKHMLETHSGLKTINLFFVFFTTDGTIDTNDVNDFIPNLRDIGF
jgi:uncharacterized BrkB/YihY/UPF0761 family membrane protein